MALETLTFAKAAEMSMPFAKRLVKRFVSPLIEEKIGKIIRTSAALKAFKSESAQYLAKVYGTCSVMNTIAFQNSPKRLEDIYIPLTIKSIAGDKESIIDKKSDIFNLGNRILIVDNAGMGKSTISKRIVKNLLEQEKGIPVFFELRKLEKGSLIEQIGNKLGISKESCKEVLSELPMLYIFDGMDEAPNELKAQAVEYINEFSTTFPNAGILITSRSETYISDFYDFNNYSVKRLDKSQALELIKKYDPGTAFTVHLLEEIKRSRRGGIHEFLSTPLYVSLLYCAYRHKSVIPNKKAIFTRKFMMHYLKHTTLVKRQALFAKSIPA